MRWMTSSTGSSGSTVQRAFGFASSKCRTVAIRHLPACIAGGLGLEVDRAMDSFTPGAGAGPAGLFEADDQLRGVRTPVDRNDEGPHVGRRVHELRVVRDDGRRRDHEVLAEVLARVAGNRVGDLADEVLDVLVARVGLVHAHEEHGEHGARRGEVDHALARARDADDAGVFVHAWRPLGHEVGRTDGSRLARGHLEIVGGALDERADFGGGGHAQASFRSSASASFSCRSEKGLHRNPFAPFSIASTAVALSASADTTRIMISGFSDTSRSTHWMPSISGIVRSMVTTSGLVFWKSSTASRPLDAEPTT